MTSNAWKQRATSQNRLRHALLHRFLLATFLCFSIHTLLAQECTIHLSVTATPATCQGNGTIQCVLTDTAGLRLEQIRDLRKEL